MIVKLFNNYCEDQLIEYIKLQLVPYFVDKKIIKTEYYIDVLVKKTKYNDSQYKSIAKFDREKALIYLCNQKELAKHLTKRLERYFEKEKDD